MDLPTCTYVATVVPSPVFIVPVIPVIAPSPSLPRPQHTRERDKALLVVLTYANGDEGVPSIPAARSDAEDMKAYLLEQGYLPDNIIILTDIDPTVRPTRDVIVRQYSSTLHCHILCHGQPLSSRSSRRSRFSWRICSPAIGVYFSVSALLPSRFVRVHRMSRCRSWLSSHLQAPH